MSSDPCNYVHELWGKGLAWLIGHSMSAGSITAGYGLAVTLRRDTMANANQPPLARL